LADNSGNAIFAPSYNKKEFFHIMKTSDFTAELSAAGCYMYRHGASHDVWYSPITKQKAAIPRHSSKEITTGTERNIRRLLGVPKK